jgi:hypothetical protein
MRRVALAIACFTGVVAVSAQQPKKVVVLHSLSAYDILYVLAGGGENALALMRDDGVVLIDPLPFGWGKATMDTIETVCDQPVRTIINIRADEAHLKANTEYPTVTRIIAHQRLAERAKTMAAFSGQNMKFRPNEVVRDRMTLLPGSDKMELFAFGPGLTDSDLVVVFPEKATAYFGALYPSNSLPAVARGESAQSFVHTLARIRTEIKGVRHVIAANEAPRAGEAGAQKVGAAMPITLTPSWQEFEEYVSRATALYEEPK